MLNSHELDGIYGILWNYLGRAGKGLENYHKFRGNIWGHHVIYHHEICGAEKMTNIVLQYKTLENCV